MDIIIRVHMLDISRAKNILKRRYDEIFLIELSKLTQDSFDYYIHRIADFYRTTKDQHPDFFEQFEKKSLQIQETLSEEFKDIDKYFKTIQPIIDSLSTNHDFMDLVKKGEKEALSNQERSHSVSTYESIFIRYSSSLSLLKSDLPKIKPTLDEAKTIALAFNILSSELKSLDKTSLIANFDSLIKDTSDVLDLIHAAETKANREFDYARINSTREIESIWQYYYEKSKNYSMISLKLHIARKNIGYNLENNILSAKNLCDELKIDLQRFYHELLDWLDAQNFLEESIINFRIWVEIINNKYFNELSKVTEEILKDEFSKYLFSSYNILVIREPDLVKKRPDFLLNIRDCKIVGEAKYIKQKTNTKKVLQKIKQGIKQLNNYSKLFPHIDAFVLLIFNYDNKTELTSQIISHMYKGKQLSIMPINVCVPPSKEDIVSYTSDNIKKIIDSF